MSVRKRLDLIAEYFGGADTVSQFVGSEDLGLILSFPGALLVTTISALVDPQRASDPVDLLELGYVPGTEYQVSDARQNLLFKGTTSRYLGGSNQAISLAASSLHGSYLYVTFVDAERIPICAIVWLMREQSPANRELTLSSIRAAATDRQKFAQVFELFITTATAQIDRERPLHILVLPGIWQAPPTVSDMLVNPNTRILPMSANRGQLLANIQDTWVAVVELRPSLVTAGAPILDTVWWLYNTYGLGTERLLPHLRDVTFIAGEGFNRLTLNTDLKRTYEANRLTVSAKYILGYQVDTKASGSLNLVTTVTSVPIIQSITFTSTPTSLPEDGV